MSESRIKELIKQRGTIKAKLTYFSNFLKSFSDSQSLTKLQFTELECRLARFSSLYTDFDNVQTEFEALFEGEDEQLYEERGSFEDKYYTLLAAATTMISDNKQAYDKRQAAVQGSNCSPNTQSEHHDFVRLPKIDLPQFDGSFQHWLEFRDTYLSLIHTNESISNINKFHYLRAALKSNASLIIQSIDFRSDNYEIAWNLLTDRFDNERLLINNHVNALFNIETAQKQASHLLRSIVDVTNKNLRALSSLGQPTEHWDTLIIHIMSKKLDLKTFTEWEEHRNSITAYPTLTQFLNTESRCIRYYSTRNITKTKRTRENIYWAPVKFRYN